MARVLLALLLALVATGAAAQSDLPFSEAAPDADEIYVENVSPQNLTFGLSHDNANWDRFQLEPGGIADYGGGGDWYILLLTEGVELRYRLDGGGSYRLYWNETDAHWDVLTCDKPACGRLDEAAP